MHKLSRACARARRKHRTWTGSIEIAQVEPCVRACQAQAQNMDWVSIDSRGSVYRSLSSLSLSLNVYRSLSSLSLNVYSLLNPLHTSHSSLFTAVLLGFTLFSSLLYSSSIITSLLCALLFSSLRSPLLFSAHFSSLLYFRGSLFSSQLSWLVLHFFWSSLVCFRGSLCSSYTLPCHRLQPRGDVRLIMSRSSPSPRGDVQPTMSRSSPSHVSLCSQCRLVTHHVSFWPILSPPARHISLGRGK